MMCLVFCGTRDITGMRQTQDKCSAQPEEELYSTTQSVLEELIRKGKSVREQSLGKKSLGTKRNTEGPFYGHYHLLLPQCVAFY